MFDVVEKCGLEVGIVTPRVRNNFAAYKDVEAALIQEFVSIYGALPLNNKQKEYSKIEHEFSRDDLRPPLMVGKGSKKYHWALEPMKSSPLFDAYHKGLDITL